MLSSEIIKKFWSTLWNTYSFFVTYANIDDWSPAVGEAPAASRPRYCSISGFCRSLQKPGAGMSRLLLKTTML